MAPASASVPTTPATARLAAATKLLPGPVTTSTGSSPRLGDAVREGADRAGAAHRVHLVDAEQPRGGEDRPGARVRRASRCGGEARATSRDAGDLGGHDVHDDARRVDGLAAGHVDARRAAPAATAGARGRPVPSSVTRAARAPARRTPRAPARSPPRAPRARAGSSAGERLVEVRGGHADVVAGRRRRTARPARAAPPRRRAATSATSCAAVASASSRAAVARGTVASSSAGEKRATAQIDRAEHPSTLARAARRRAGSAARDARRRRAGSRCGRPRGARRTPRRGPRCTSAHAVGPMRKIGMPLSSTTSRSSGASAQNACWRAPCGVAAAGVDRLEGVARLRRAPTRPASAVAGSVVRALGVRRRRSRRSRRAPSLRRRPAANGRGISARRLGARARRGRGGRGVTARTGRALRCAGDLAAALEVLLRTAG